MDSNELQFNTKRPKGCISKKMFLNLTIGGEDIEVQEYTDGNDAGSVKNNSSASR